MSTRNYVTGKGRRALRILIQFKFKTNATKGENIYLLRYYYRLYECKSYTEASPNFPIISPNYGSSEQLFRDVIDGRWTNQRNQIKQRISFPSTLDTLYGYILHE